MAGPPGTQGMRPRERQDHYTDDLHNDLPTGISEQRTDRGRTEEADVSLLFWKHPLNLQKENIFFLPSSSLINTT